nr:cell death-related nuclease 6 [Crassostrea gigas]
MILSIAFAYCSKMTRLAKLIVFLGSLRYIQGSASCKSSDGKEVDWFIIYKVPKLTSPNKTSGTEFFYMDTASPSFSFSQKDITKSIENPLYETLKALYDQSPDIVTYAMYNDQPPPTVKAADGRHAHSKETVFGTTNPYIYDKKNFDIKISNPMNSVHIPIKTFGNVQLEILAKSASFGQDIYDKLISPKLADHLLVRTWRPKLLDTAMVSNVINACFPNKIAFNHGIDHSKWAVTENKHLICIGDINRQETQAKRGGLSLCLTNAGASKEFRELSNRCAANNKNVPPRGICPNPKRAKISP